MRVCVHVRKSSIAELTALNQTEFPSHKYMAEFIMFTQTHTCTRTCTRFHTQTHTHTFTHTGTVARPCCTLFHTHPLSHTHTHSHTYTYTYIHTHTHIHTQALWRGHAARMKDGRQKAEVRRRLHAAAVAGARNPHRTIGARVHDALAQLMARKDPAQVRVMFGLFVLYIDVARDVVPVCLIGVCVRVFVHVGA